jgi:septum formation protein
MRITAPMSRPSIVLASTSAFRRELLERLGLGFEVDSPGVEEATLAGEDAEQMVMRLAMAKARAVAPRHPHALIIGSDQCAVLGDRVLGKPGTHERARKQLQALSGQRVVFYTGLCLLNADTGALQSDAIPFTVVFRSLTHEQIERYLQAEHPYDCAGSFKSEGLGIALFERLLGEDPTALIGLPLIRLVEMLAREDIVLP